MHALNDMVISNGLVVAFDRKKFRMIIISQFIMSFSFNFNKIGESCHRDVNKRQATKGDRYFNENSCVSLVAVITRGTNTNNNATQRMQSSFINVSAAQGKPVTTCRACLNVCCLFQACHAGYITEPFIHNILSFAD